MKIDIKYDGEPTFEFTPDEIRALAREKASFYNKDELETMIADTFADEWSDGAVEELHEAFLESHGAGLQVSFQEHMAAVLEQYSS